MSESQNKNDVNIIVNGRPKKVAPTQTFESIVALAFNPAPPGAFFTVTWSHGNKGGSLVAGQSITVENGMMFDVTETGQS